MMLQWADLCDAAGFDVRSMDPTTCYLLAGKIIQDEPLRQLALKETRSVMPAGLRAEMLRELPESERIALRERVSGVVQIKKGL